jgi:hypothetical protein
MPCWLAPIPTVSQTLLSELNWCCCAVEFTSELCAETWVVKDGTATALLKGVRIEGAGEQVGTFSVLLPVTVSHLLWPLQQTSSPMSATSTVSL